MKSITLIINIIFCIVNCVLGYMAGRGSVESKYFLLGMVLMLLADVFLYWISVIARREQ